MNRKQSNIFVLSEICAKLRTKLSYFFNGKCCKTNRKQDNIPKKGDICISNRFCFSWNPGIHYQKPSAPKEFWSIVKSGTRRIGRTKYLHSSCPCQKHPLNKITVRYFFRTISGDLGNFFTLSLYLNPCKNRNLRTRSSGLVPLLLMLCIHFLLCCRFNLSAIQ